MCTVTFAKRPGGFLLTMNRDERLERAAELPPTWQDDGRWFGPLDGARGGTWFGASPAGFAVCLLNGYQPSDADRRGADVPSRGVLVPALLRRGSVAGALRWMEQEFDAAPFPSFTLLLAHAEGLLRWRWRGEGRLGPAQRIEGAWAMVSSSSWRQEEVLAWRQEEFARWEQAGHPFDGAVPSFHLLQPAGWESWAPRMRRSYAATRSITQADFRAEGPAVLRHWVVEERALVGPQEMLLC